ALLAQQQSPQFEPGTAFSYSNSNYLLLAEIVARITGKPFASHAGERLKAWGLNQSFYLADHNRDIPNLAKPYFDFGKWYYYRWRSHLYADGALFTTLRDQLQWEMKLQTELDQLELLLASQQRLPSPVDDHYGYGVEFDTYRGLPRIRHEGSTSAWQASFMRFPAQDVAIVVMSNSGAVYPNGVAQRIANQLLADDLMEEKPFPTGPESVQSEFTDEQLLGTYTLENGYYFRIRQDGSQWLLERPNRDAIVIEREEGDLFQEVADPAFKQSFTLNEDGQQTVTAYYPTHNPFTLTKLADFPADFQAQQWAGKYRNLDTGVTVQLVDRGQNTFALKFQGEKRQKRDGVLLSPTIMNAQGYGLEFSEADGRKQFALSNNRIRGLQFVRVE
ncbi:MAG: serine hydrolase domain-containing protein, partial [Bacteroidota bacterium]